VGGGGYLPLPGPGDRVHPSQLSRISTTVLRRGLDATSLSPPPSLLTSFFKRQFQSRTPLPNSHKKVLNQLAQSVWGLCGTLPVYQRDLGLRCVEEIGLPERLGRGIGCLRGFRMWWTAQLSKLRSSEVQRKGHIFKSNWLDFCRLFSAQNGHLGFDNHGWGGGATLSPHAVPAEGQWRTPPPSYSDIIPQLTSLLSSPAFLLSSLLS